MDRSLAIFSTMQQWVVNYIILWTAIALYFLTDQIIFIYFGIFVIFLEGIKRFYKSVSLTD
ncbi:MAG: hypothetical protein ACXAB7_20260 [Candidatus Kariarchaeaceae archaeon]|jgi:hypothetical protein